MMLTLRGVEEHPSLLAATRGKPGMNWPTVARNVLSRQRTEFIGIHGFKSLESSFLLPRIDGTDGLSDLE